ncbi:nitrite reductase large subunit [Shewanella avicenniae]|uniref:Nitrite reductase large subunit n=1 Tax=Shewanella avicenniae TaxID=2814294 RepID=A0ABX7QNA0_9GAMM|nr:nitrite reductase large subunit NirB [Shewanella avicenniae]QSX32368.1 nitrite reductase large subunit [Shewanella avicenniae]
MSNFESKPKLVVVGNGMVGHNFVEQLCEQGLQQHLDVLVIGAEKRVAYDRVQLSSYFNGAALDDLAMTTAEQYAEWGVSLKLGATVVGIDSDAKSLLLADGTRESYDKLVLATGSYGFVPPINGRDREGCMVYRTTDDLLAIEAAAKNAKTGVVIGGGLLGLEAANALKLLGLKTHVVEFAPQLMPVQLDAKAGALLKAKIAALGVEIHTSKVTQEIVDGETGRLRLKFADGALLDTDMLVFSAGIRPYDNLSDSCALEKGARGGYAVDNFCQTTVADVYAIGECASWQDRIFGLVAPGYQMAKVALGHIVHSLEIAEQHHGDFLGADMSTKLKLMGVDVAAIGNSRGSDDTRFVELMDEPAGIYKKLWLNDAGNVITGALLVGDTSDYGTLLNLYLSGHKIEGSAAAMLLSGDAPALPKSNNDLICSCHQVRRGSILKAVAEGAASLGDIKRCTKAASGCGGCSASVQKVINEGLAAQGVEVSKALCSHFEYSRQELFHLCQVEGIKDFATLLAKHGKSHVHGVGCNTCQPAAASIFASLYNGHVLSESRGQLQDTNDAFLGNLQKDGTYSVVPRIAGGEITPDKLIAIGEVAKRYDLYTKITGGQRIDLFGAKLSELPEIWEQLIAAGFETGHAYGKSLRTVKSCVGSTWCRYGVQNSVGMAIELENRYKGLRSPHKLKMAVSGCTRECAEAQGKDIGVIATDKGWNLYVCGNGGMKPRHADLFASDLNDAELVELIDKVLMFYVRTADKLQRTSVWLESLDGGLDYLKQVILEDSLGIGDELLSQMQAVVDSYQCEWKTSVETPELRARFSEFVNPQAAPTAAALPYQRVRGQRIPAINLTPAAEEETL